MKTNYCTKNEVGMPINMQELITFSDFLENINTEVPEISISLLPNVVKETMNYFQERKKIKIQNQQFEKKCKLVSDIAEKQYLYSVCKIKKDAEIALNQINSNTEIEIMKIKSRTLEKISALQMEYKYKHKKLDMHYQMVEQQIKQEMKTFDKMITAIKYKVSQRDKAIKELEVLCCYLQNKITKNNASQQDKDMFIQCHTIRNNLITQDIDLFTGIISSLPNHRMV